MSCNDRFVIYSLGRPFILWQVLGNTNVQISLHESQQILQCDHSISWELARKANSRTPELEAGGEA